MQVSWGKKYACGILVEKLSEISGDDGLMLTCSLLHQQYDHTLFT
jgi:hypothetical protein